MRLDRPHAGFATMRETVASARNLDAAVSLGEHPVVEHWLGPALGRGYGAIWGAPARTEPHRMLHSRAAVEAHGMYCVSSLSDTQPAFIDPLLAGTSMVVFVWVWPRPLRCEVSPTVAAAFTFPGSSGSARSTCCNVSVRPSGVVRRVLVTASLDV